MILQRFLRKHFYSRYVLLDTFKKMSTEPEGKLKITHKVNNFERRILVWTGKYKTIGEVPDAVGQHVMERARNIIRIRVANYMIAATVVGCAIMIFLGKRSRDQGESVAKWSEDWHKELRKENVQSNAK
ncbi:hypothetical protein WA026_004169 [Henosepilachna vigintioctopunctata]|uniref:Uncharacterized protein n=1 Tax=Henosepilachna vigintioctopunctata TaxID=420089 RepID=A0AAW1UHW8_9CUCU